MADDVVVRVSVDTAEALAATFKYSQSLEKLQIQQDRAAAAQAKLDAALASSGAGSAEATAAQAKYEAALRRTSVAESQVAIAAARSSEVQAAAANKAAAAQEAAAAKQAAALKKVGTIAGTIGTAIAVGFAVAAKSAADFQSKLAQVQSLSGATASQMQQLSLAAHGYANLGIGASDAADAEIELTKAGLSVQQILGGGLRSALLLAADGQMNVADATKIAASAMVQFRLPAAQMGHVADDLAAGADKALGSVQDLGEGLTYAGLGAHQAGLSLDETVGALAEFAQAGLIGAQGGTTLQQVLRQLLSPTQKAAAEIKTLGLNLYDSQGHFVGLASVAQQLKDTLGPMSEAERNAALGTLFTSRAVRGATILYNDGAAGVNKWVKAVNDSGFAAKQAQGKMDSLQGDLQKLGAVLQNDLIDVGEQLQPILRAITQDLETVGNVIGDLPDPVKAVAVQFGAVVGALGLGFWAFTRIRTAAVGLAETLGILAKAQVEVAATAGTMAAGEDVAAASMTGAGSAAVISRGKFAALGGGLGAILAGQLVKQYAGGNRAGSIGGSVLEGAGAGAVAGSFVPVIGTGVGALIGGTLGAIHGARSSDSAGMDAVRALLAREKAAQDRQAAFLKLGSAAQSTKVLDELGIAGDSTSRSLANVGESAADAGRSLVGMGQAALSGFQGVKSFGNALDALLSPKMDLSAATDQWISGLQGLAAGLSKTTKSLDGFSAGAEQNRSAIRTQVTNMEGLLNAQAKAGVGAHALSQHLVEMRQKLIDAGTAAGISKADMTKYLGVLGLTPKLVGTIIKNNAPQAEQDIWNYRHAIDGVPGFKNTVITADTQSALAKMAYVQRVANSLHGTMWINVQYTGAPIHSGVQVGPASGGYITRGKLRKFAGGGYARYYRGPGTGTSDSIPAMVSNGEFVNKASVVSRETPAAFFALNQGRASIVSKSYLANGGMANYQTPPPMRQWSGGSYTAARDDRALVGAIAAVQKEVAAVKTALTDGSQKTGLNSLSPLGNFTYQMARDAIRQDKIGSPSGPGG